MNPLACHLCGRSFNKNYNLQRHLKNIHGEEQTMDADDDIFSEKDSNEEMGDESKSNSSDVEDEGESSSELEDNIGYLDWLEEAKKATGELWNEKHQKYINEGMSEDDARFQAKRKTLWAVKRHFFDILKNFMLSYLRLKDDETFLVMVNDIEEKVLEKGMDIDTALKRVLPKHKSNFEGLFEEDPDEEDEETEEENEY